MTRKTKTRVKISKLIFPGFASLWICFIFLSCANPFGKGTWDPLPFKKKTQDEVTLSSDTAKVKTGIKK